MECIILPEKRMLHLNEQHQSAKKGNLLRKEQMRLFKERILSGRECRQEQQRNTVRSARLQGQPRGLELGRDCGLFKSAACCFIFLEAGMPEAYN